MTMTNMQDRVAKALTAKYTGARIYSHRNEGKLGYILVKFNDIGSYDSGFDSARIRKTGYTRFYMSGHDVTVSRSVQNIVDHARGL